jgi:hypothetical protein
VAAAITRRGVVVVGPVWRRAGPSRTPTGASGRVRPRTPGRERAPGTPVDGAAAGTPSRDATSERRRVGWGRRSPCDERRRNRAPRCPRFAAVLGAGARRVSRRGLRERRAGLCRPCGGPRCDVFHVKRSRGSRYRVRRTVRSSGAPIERPSGDTCGSDRASRRSLRFWFRHGPWFRLLSQFRFRHRHRRRRGYGHRLARLAERRASR